MSPIESTISIETLRELVSLDAASGKLYWKNRDVRFFGGNAPMRSCNTWNSRFSGKEAFCVLSGSGYLHGALFDNKICAHRIVFALYNGAWPSRTIDHVNGVRTDNRPENLRDVSHIENMRNQPVSRASTTGFTGVSFDTERKSYEAYITINGKKKTLGRFDSASDAVAARAEANKNYGFHSNHGRG